MARGDRYRRRHWRPEHSDHDRLRQEKRKAGFRRRGRGENHSAAESLRACGGARHCLSLQRAIRPGRHRAPRRHEPDRRPAVASHLLLRSRTAGGAAEGVGGQGRERRRGPARIDPPRADELAREQRRMEGRSGTAEGGIDLANKPVPPRPVPRLYLATPVVDDPALLMASLPGLLAAADVAAVLLRLKPTDQRTMISRIKTLAPVIQDGGAALLLDGHVELVARAGADGAHLTGIEAMEDAMPTLKPDRIAGVGGLATRHDSMAAGEAGADFVLVGDFIWNDKRGAKAALMEAEQTIRQAHAAMSATARAEQG